MRRLSNTAIKRIIAGSLALALTFTSVGLNNFTWADEDEVEEVQEVDVDENANTDETIDQGSESELPTDEVVTSDEETEDVASNDENAEEETDAKTSKETIDTETSEEDANSKDATSESDDAEKCEHEDADEDGTCDKCGKSMSDEEAEICEHVDEDEDGICDKCGEEMPKEDVEESEKEKVFSLNSTEVKLLVGETFTVEATLDNEDVTGNINLSTEDEFVEINNNTILAKTAGTAIIAVSYVLSDKTYEQTLTVTVEEGEPEVIDADDFASNILMFYETNPVLAPSEDKIDDVLPKTTPAYMIVSKDAGYDENTLYENGFTSNSILGDYVKERANVEVEWTQTGTNPAGGIEYRGTIVSDQIERYTGVSLPKLTVYIYDGEYSGKIDPNTFIPIATDGNPVSSYTGELPLCEGYPSRIEAWEAKYAPNGARDLILNYEPGWTDDLQPGTKEIAEGFVSIARHSDDLMAYLNALTLEEFFTLADTGKVDLSSTFLAGTKIPEENLRELAKYGFTVQDVSDYITTFNGHSTNSKLYTIYKMGNSSEGLEMLNATVEEAYATNKLTYKSSMQNPVKNLDNVEITKATNDVIQQSIDTGFFEESTEELIEDIPEEAEKTSLLDLFANKFAFINVSAKSGDGWRDDLIDDEGNESAPSHLVHVNYHDKKNMGANHSTYMKEGSPLDGTSSMFCVTPDKTIMDTYVYSGTTVKNGWACLFADDSIDYYERQAMFWYVMSSDSDLKAAVKAKYTGAAHPFFALVCLPQEIAAQKVNEMYRDKVDNAWIDIYIASINGTHYQILYHPRVYQPIPTGDVSIDLVQGTYNDSARTVYKTDLDKYSVITNEKLSGIQFKVEENVFYNPQSSNDISEGEWTAVTNQNGYASITSEHYASWSEPYTDIANRSGIDEYIESGEASSTFIQYYESLKTSIAEGENGLCSYDTARSIVQQKKNAFLAVEYDYTWTEQNTYNRPASSSDQNNKTLDLINLPKQGYRMNITKIDNSNKYSAVSNSDLTSPSTKTTSAVHDGGNGHVDISNQPWRAQIFINKTDLETNNQIKYDTKFDIYEMENGKYPDEPSKNYRVVRINEEIASEMNWDKSTVGMYTIEYIGTTFGGTNPADDKQHTPLKYGTVYYTQSNTGKFKIVETKAPSYEDGKTGYIGNFAMRPYTRVENDLDSRFALSGRTDKTYPTPQKIVKVAAGNCRYCQFKKVLHHLYVQE